MFPTNSSYACHFLIQKSIYKPDSVEENQLFLKRKNVSYEVRQSLFFVLTLLGNQ